MTSLFKKSNKRPECFNCRNLRFDSKGDNIYRCLSNNINSINDWCVDWKIWEKESDQDITPYLEIGFTMFDFNKKLPEEKQT